MGGYANKEEIGRWKGEVEWTEEEVAERVAEGEVQWMGHAGQGIPPA